MKNVLLITDGDDHPPYNAIQVLIQMLKSMKGFSLNQIDSIEKLTAVDLKADAMVLYYHVERISNLAFALLEGFISEGGGALAIHSATASFMERPHYFEILGGSFKEHGPVSNFEVLPVPETNIFDSIKPFTVKDELYIHEAQFGITPHFITIFNNMMVPMVWTYHYKKGRICYAAPGHRAETMRHKDYQRILKRALLWVSN